MMISKRHPLLSLFLCLAFVIALLPLVGAMEPATVGTVPISALAFPIVPSANPNMLEVKNVKGEMVSPNEFGVGLSVRYPAALLATKKRYLTIATTVNDKPLRKTYDVTRYTSPGNLWEATQNGGHVASNTPLRINLATEGVSRFSTDLQFSVTVTASYEGGTETTSSTGSAKVFLPVIYLHGACPPREYPHCSVEYLPDNYANFAGYYLFTRHLLSRGYNEGSGYRTLYAPGTESGMYTNPTHATVDVIRDDMQKWVDTAKVNSYASRVNFVGHSFGGLASRYYASQRPENVNKVIAVGSPFEGVTFFYENMFAWVKNREEGNSLITTPGGQPNVNLWGVPIWNALVLPPNAPGSINVQVSNTYPTQTQPGVEYHFIYATNVATNRTLTLVLNGDGRWYHVRTSTTTGGDGSVVDFSGGNIHGPTGSNIFRHPIQVGSSEYSWGLMKTNHQTLMMDNIVHEEVMKAIFRDTPFENTL